MLRRAVQSLYVYGKEMGREENDFGGAMGFTAGYERERTYILPVPGRIGTVRSPPQSGL